MWPWGHLAVGYLVYSILIHLSGNSLRDYPTLSLMFGTQFPDLVDKPLAWTFGVIPNGRSLTHSIFTAVILIVVLRVLLRRYGYGSLATAFGIGYLLHLAGDALGPLVAREYYYLGFLGWPLVPPIDYGEKSFVAQFASLELASFSAVDIGLVLLFFGLWMFDGRPGLKPLLSAPRRAYRQVLG